MPATAQPGYGGPIRSPGRTGVNLVSRVVIARCIGAIRTRPSMPGAWQAAEQDAASPERSAARQTANAIIGQSCGDIVHRAKRACALVIIPVGHVIERAE